MNFQKIEGLRKGSVNYVYEGYLFIKNKADKETTYCHYYHHLRSMKVSNYYLQLIIQTRRQLGFTTILKNIGFIRFPNIFCLYMAAVGEQTRRSSASIGVFSVRCMFVIQIFGYSCSASNILLTHMPLKLNT